MKTGVLLIGHGSPVRRANEDLLHLVADVRATGRYAIVEGAFLEKVSPSIPEGLDLCVQQGAERVLVLPYFLLLGSHVGEDVPQIVAQARERHRGVRFVIGQSLGDHPLLAEIVLERVRNLLVQ